MLPEVPRTSASVLVALATMGGVPNRRSVGNVTSVPPPATALIAPPAAAASTSPTISVHDIVRAQSSGASGKAQVGRQRRCDYKCWAPIPTDRGCVEDQPQQPRNLNRAREDVVPVARRAAAGLRHSRGPADI